MNYIKAVTAIFVCIGTVYGVIQQFGLLEEAMPSFTGTYQVTEFDLLPNMRNCNISSWRIKLLQDQNGRITGNYQNPCGNNSDTGNLDGQVDGENASLTRNTIGGLRGTVDWQISADGADLTGFGEFSWRKPRRYTWNAVRID